ncbi:MAG: type II secretion system protein N [Gallionella sp.]|jgi:general secretion pathway protein N
MRSLALFGATYFAGMLLITAPASWLSPLIRHISHEKLSLANCQGTLWHGSATPALHIGKNSTLALHTLNWKFKPQALLRGQFQTELSWDDLQTATPMTLTLSRQAITLSHARLNMPARVIDELSPFLKPAQFSGNLTLESPQLSYADNHLLGNATARWNQAGSALSAVRPLGDYQIELSAAQDGINAVLTTQHGALLLAGQGNWSPQQGLHFNGTAGASPATEASLSELLHHLGPEITHGVYRISL